MGTTPAKIGRQKPSLVIFCKCHQTEKQEGALHPPGRIVEEGWSNLYPIRNLKELQGEDLARAERFVKDSRFDWRGKKMGVNRLARLYEVAGWLEYATRAAGCDTFMQFEKWNNNGERRLQWANFCDLRLCPVCTGRRAIKNAAKLSQVMNMTVAKYGYQFIFLTLTVQNCEGDKLGETISQLTAAWNRLVQQRPVLAAVKGWFRAIEITHGQETGYHPHIHAILAVEQDYKPRSKKYIKQAEWVRRWQMALKVDYKPIVDIRKTKDGKGGMAAALEAAKYTTKDSEYINPKLSEQEGAQIVVDYTKALRGRRLVAYGGVMKDIAAQIGADKEDDDLVHLGDEGVRDDLADLIETYGWHFGAGDFILIDRRVNPLKVVKKDG